MGKAGKKVGKVATFGLGYNAAGKLIKKLKGDKDTSREADLKVKKQAAKEYLKGAPFRKEALQRTQDFAAGTDPLSQQLRSEFGVGGKAYQGTQGYDQAKQVFDPVAEYARANFQQQTLPDVMNQFGRGSKTSSALNQALAAAGANLHLGLNAQFAPLVQEERARQQQMQYNTIGDLYNAQSGANQNLSNAGNNASTISQNAGQIPPRPNAYQRFANIALPVAGGVVGGVTGGPAGVPIGVQTGNAVNQGLQS
jgi:hypothetical protein